METPNIEALELAAVIGSEINVMEKSITDRGDLPISEVDLKKFISGSDLSSARQNDNTNILPPQPPQPPQPHQNNVSNEILSELKQLNSKLDTILKRGKLTARYSK